MPEKVFFYFKRRSAAFQLRSCTFSFSFWVNLSPKRFFNGIDEAAVVYWSAKGQNRNNEILGRSLVLKIETEISAFIQIQIPQLGFSGFIKLFLVLAVFGLLLVFFQKEFDGLLKELVGGTFLVNGKNLESFK